MSLVAITKLGYLHGLVKQFFEGLWRISGCEHGSKDGVRIGFRSRLAEREFVVKPNIHDDLFPRRESKEEPVAAVELCPEPMAIIESESIALAKFA